jgi:hypothetical protein
LAFTSKCIPEKDQQGEKDQWDHNIVIERCPRVVSGIVVGDNDLLYMAYRIA